MRRAWTWTGAPPECEFRLAVQGSVEVTGRAAWQPSHLPCPALLGPRLPGLPGASRTGRRPVSKIDTGRWWSTTGDSGARGSGDVPLAGEVDADRTEHHGVP